MNQASWRVSSSDGQFLVSHFVAATIAAFGNRTIHTYHTEGAGEKTVTFCLLPMLILVKVVGMPQTSSRSAALKTFCLRPQIRRDPTRTIRVMNTWTYVEVLR